MELPRMYSFLEEKIKGYLTQKGIQRGKIEIYVGVDVLEQKGLEVYLDRAAAALQNSLVNFFQIRKDI